jgi:signal transduction histidine kinase
VAFRWRIRHKLMLGLGLVVGIIAFLLAGTLYGVASFRLIMKGIGCKQAEMSRVQEFKEEINNLNSLGNQLLEGKADTRTQMRIPLASAQKALSAYEEALDGTIEMGQDLDGGVQETGLVRILRQNLDKLNDLIKRNAALARGFKGTDEPRGIDIEIKALVATMAQEGNDLSSEITRELSELSRDAQQTFRTSLWIVFSIGIGGVLLLCSFLRFFYRWVFYPIRDLEQGAGRVAQGDFEHRIEVHSGDEMEDLSDAFNDMTSRLREMYRDLARQVNERSRQLVRSERLASVGFLAAGVAHEINNPLASIAFCSEALEARLDNALAQAPEHGEVVRKYLRMIQQEAFRCKDITQKLLEFSRGGERRREPIDLSELIQGVLDMARHLPNCKGKTIHFEPSGRLVASVNGQEIKSVVLNLVVNALDSMDEGGTLDINLHQRDGMAAMVFADTGCGMTDEVLENIFEPFFTRSRTGKGTGLGLSISHRVISQHGGEIEAASSGPGQGSTFTVRLPLKAAVPMREETFGQLAA